jgi:hypothetical protein
MTNIHLIYNILNKKSIKMYTVVVDRTTSENIYLSIEKYLYNFGNNYIESHFKISQAQLNNIYQQMDVGVYEDLEEMYHGFNNEVGTRGDINITKGKYKKVILMLLAYHNNLIDFS